MKKIISLFAFVSLVACSKSKDTPFRSGNSITLFQLQIEGGVQLGTINNSSNIIAFDLVDADLSSLRPTITISEGATISPAPTAPQNFNQEVKYTVTAENGDQNSYTVVVNNKISSPENLITQFELPINGENIAGEIDQTNNTITFDLVGADLDSLTPLVEISENATVSPSNSSLNFNEEVTFTVTAENGDTRAYTIMVNNRELSTDSDILSFIVGINGEDIEARIDNDLKEIAFETGSFNISRLVPEITVSENATISPSSGEPVDFTKPITYTVTAENGSMREYTIVINEAYHVGTSTVIGPRTGGQKLYTRARMFVITHFLDPNTSGAQLYLFDGENRIDLPILEVVPGENQRIISYFITTQIPENTPTNPSYSVMYERDDLRYESDSDVDVLAEDAPEITSINQTSFSRDDTIIITGTKLTGTVMVPSNGSQFILKDTDNFIDIEINAQQTEFRLLLDNQSQVRSAFPSSASSRDIIFIGPNLRLGAQITVDLEL